MKLHLTFIFSLLTCLSFSQTINVLTSGTKTSLRGLSVVNNDILWASGSNGTVARSVDGGKTFTWLTVTGYEQRDFRDVEAFDSSTAIIMAVAEPAIILKTKDGGKSWKKVFEDTTKGMFLDAMDFYGKKGIVVGDPINGKVFEASTKNKGDSWVIGSSDSLKAGEAFFAASGTNIKLHKFVGHLFYTIMVTGGEYSEFISSIAGKAKLPLKQGKESTGANSIDCSETNYCIIVGGDFANDKDTTGNCTIATFQNSDQIKFDFSHPQTPPHGYRSCVEFINQNKFITCGTSGVDISNDGGNSWTLISSESFHVCQKARNGTSVFLAGKDGRIAKLNQ